jgi:SAM-dependent methyltransferase
VRAWDYTSITSRRLYGETITCQLSVDFLDEVGGVIEDWGCGMGGAKDFVQKSEYVGIDFTPSPFTDLVIDLEDYCSKVDCILVRHVLEHNHNWKKILENAVGSFTQRLALILFTPFSDVTRDIAPEEATVPDYSFKLEDIMSCLKGLDVKIEELITDTQYGVEYIFYIKRPNMKDKCELEFQEMWVKTFVNNKNKVLEYWEQFRRFDLIKSVCRFNQNTKVLDVGCGISTILHFVEGRKFGVDTLADTYKALYEYPEDMTITNSPAECLLFEDEYFDVVFCSNALDHFDDIDKASNEICRVLKLGGIYVLAVEVFNEKEDRIDAHPYCLLEEDIISLTMKYCCLYMETLPWYGLREFAEDRGLWNGKEMLLILKKCGRCV